ncbi:hypothetical protein AVEN_144703-1 [Araneus ventricosus]|uniref:Uncharacterized protein n=1 Tax=Araneus ventricosus TaxID=182803 RepID=A0A4Y2LQQ4_ARAVE|nr:hypothetical protein AVEN_144703-1 [Araneus ventricosus]
MSWLTKFDNFLDIGGNVHNDLEPLNLKQSTNNIMQVSLLLYMNAYGENDLICGKNKSWLLHLENAPAPNSVSVKTFLANNGIHILENQLYSPDLAPCYFFLFPVVNQR